VPGEGTVVIGSGATPARLSARAGKPAFQTATQTVADDGVITFKPKLSKKLKKKLRKGKKVRLTVSATYRSPGGTVSTQVTKVVLQKPRK
jgi:hypothetical protein